jgi:hypothetical protein
LRLHRRGEPQAHMARQIHWLQTQSQTVALLVAVVASVVAAEKAVGVDMHYPLDQQQQRQPHPHPHCHL